MLAHIKRTDPAFYTQRQWFTLNDDKGVALKDESEELAKYASDTKCILHSLLHFFTFF